MLQLKSTSESLQLTTSVLSNAPTLKGYSYINNSGSSTTLTIAPDSTIAVGDWMILVLETYSGAGAITDPTGWTVLQASSTTAGTLVTAIYAKLRATNETSYSVTMSANANASNLTLMWGSGAAPITSWTIGSNMLRGSISPSTSTNNVAPSVTTTSANNLVLSLSTEQSTASESGIVSMTGSSEWFYGGQYSTTTTQTLSVGYVNKTTAGATGDVTIVYPATSANNGMARQIAIPPGSANLDYSVSYTDTSAGTSVAPSSNEGIITTTTAAAHILKNDWSTGTNGTNITAANSGGSGQDAGTPVLSSIAITYDSSLTHNSMYSAKYVYSNSSAGYLTWNFTPSSTTTRIAFNFYFYFDAGSTTTNTSLFMIRNSSAYIVQVALDASGKLIVYGAGGSASWAASSAISTATWYRVEGAITVGTTTSNGAISIDYYADDLSSSIQNIVTSTTANMGTTIATLARLGSPGTVATARTMRYGTITVQELASGYIGPPTTTILAAPAASTNRLVKLISITNTDPYIASTIVVQKNISGTYYRQAPPFTLLAGETAQYMDKVGWKYYATDGTNKADQTALLSTSTQLQYNVSGVLDQSTLVAPTGVWTQQTGSGSRNWQGVASSSDGMKLAAIENPGYAYTSTDGGVTWTQQTGSGSRAWNNITCSSDGTKLIATINGGYIYTSADSGVTWTQQTGAGTNGWYFVACSSDGTKVAATVYGSSYIYTSSDSGVTWTQQANSYPANGQGIAMSSDGLKIAATCYGHNILTSTDGGVNWTFQGSAGVRNWLNIASSADGTQLLASTDGDFLYLSKDSGVTWAQLSPPAQYWADVASSADGTRLAAVGSGVIYLSTDSGATWAQQTITGSNNSWYIVASSADGKRLAVIDAPGYIYTYGLVPTYASIPTWTTSSAGIAPNPIAGLTSGSIQQSNSSLLQWSAMASSADGTKLIASTYGTAGHIYTSTDSGMNWTQQTGSPLVNVRHTATSSADGTKLAMAANGGYIYTSSDSGVTWTQQTSAGSHTWEPMASSADGTILVAGDAAPGYLYTSSDSGVTWTQQTSAGSHTWHFATASADGTKLAVSTADPSYIYTSSDSGVTWTQQTGSGSRNWGGIASSADGSKLIATDHSGTGYIYLSNDFGVTWNPVTTMGTQAWYLAASSADGTVLWVSTASSYLYRSTDSGATWTAFSATGSPTWEGLAMSADGTKVSVGDNTPGYIYNFNFPVQASKTLMLSPGNSVLALETWTSDPSPPSVSYVSGPIPTIIGASNYNAGGGITPSVTTPSSTQVGDLTIIVGYVEPYNEATSTATFGTFTLPTGVTLASGFPIETNPSTLTSANDHRMYVWYYYATTAGVATLTFSNSSNIYWGLASVTVRGGPTSGDPFADTPSTAVVATNASGVTSTPPVALTLGGPNSLVLWAYTDWVGPNPSYPTGFTDASHASNYSGQPAIGFANYASAGSTGTISATRSNNDQGMGAALLSLRAGVVSSAPYIASAGTPARGSFGTSTSSINIPVPTGVVAGDLIVIAMGIEWPSTTLPDTTSLSSPGFTVAQMAAYQSYTNYAETSSFLYKYASAADTGNYVVTLNTVGGQLADIVAGAAAIVRGGPSSGNPFVDAYQTTHGVNSQTITVPSFTPTADNTLLLASVWYDDNASTLGTYPAGWTVQANFATGTSTMLTSFQQTTAAATGSLTWGSSTGSPDPVVLIGAIRAPTTSYSTNYAPTIASTSALVQNSGTTIAVPVPTGVVTGSLVLVFTAGSWTNPPNEATAIIPAPGFVLAGSNVWLDQTYGLWSSSAWYYKYASASDPGNYTFTIGSDSGGAAGLGGEAYSLLIEGGPSYGNPFIDSFQSAYVGTRATTVTIPAFTPSVDNTLLLAGISADDDNSHTGTISVPSGWTIARETDNTAVQAIVGIASTSQTKAVSTGSLVFTASATNMFSVLIGTIRPADPVPVVSVPTNALALHGRTTSGRSTISVIDTVLSSMTIQASLWQNNTMLWTPSGNVGTWQGTNGATLGTATSVLPTTTNVYTAMRRSTFSSVATTTNQQVGIRSESMFFRGGGTGQGGFFFSCRFGFDTIATGMRAFIGFSPTTVIVSADPSTVANTLGFGFDLADTAFSFYHNGPTGIATKEPISGQGTLATNNTGYDAYIWSPPNSPYVYYRLDRTDTGATLVDSYVTANLPSPTVMLQATAQMSNGTANVTDKAAVLGINRLYVETNR